MTPSAQTSDRLLWPANFLRRWHKLDLGKQFLLVSAATLIGGMFIVGSWLSHQIKVATTHAAGGAVALFTDSLIESHVQELRTSDVLSAPQIEALDALVERSRKGGALVGLKIWKGQKIVYSNHAHQISKSYPGNTSVAKAEAGAIVAQFDHLDEEDEKLELEMGTPILEMYAPVRGAGTQRVIAVAETYGVADQLASDILGAKQAAWLIIGGMTAAMLAMQSVVVRGASRTISNQREALDHRIEELTKMSDENQALHSRMKEAHGRLDELNERILRRIGADLHDGPVQLLGAATMRASAVHDTISKADPKLGEAVSPDMELLQDAISDTLDEIRHLSSGLAPPDTEKLSLGEVIEFVIRRHERRTSTTVTRKIDGLPEALTLPQRIGVYRFIQEGLSNTARHAGGQGQTVSARSDTAFVEVAVADTGPGIEATRGKAGYKGGHGLAGLADRMISLNSELQITSSPQGGTRLIARFRI